MIGAGIDSGSLKLDRRIIAGMTPGRSPGAAVSCVLLFFCLYLPAGFAQSDPTAAQLTESFAHPPDDCRIMMRWWWFGPAVTKPEIQRELEQMKAAGIGGVEIATLYPQALDDLQTGFRNLPYLSDEYIDALRFAASEATRLGLRIDVTLGSGWPFGGPHIPVTQAAGEMRVETVAIPANARSIVAPGISTGERLIAMFLVPGSGDALTFSEAKAVPISAIENGRLKISADLKGTSSAVFFISSRTGMMVKRPAVGAEGFVLDHYDQSATENHLHAVGDRLLEAFGVHPPYAVFSDSLEDYGSNWTGDLLEQFRQRRGYDLTPHCRHWSPMPDRRRARSDTIGQRLSPNLRTNVFSRLCTPGRSSITLCSARRLMDSLRSRSPATGMKIFPKARARQPC